MNFVRRSGDGSSNVLAILLAGLVLSLVTNTSAFAGFRDAFEQYNAQNYAAARREADPDPERGNPAAQWLLGTSFLLGHDVDEDPMRARGWFEKSAVSNYPPSQAVLGRMFEEGIGGEQDPHAAHNLYYQSAQQGYADAAYLLGRQFYYGRGIEKNDNAALKWLTIAADDGNADARFLGSKILLTNEIFKANPKQAGTYNPDKGSTGSARRPQPAWPMQKCG